MAQDNYHTPALLHESLAALAVHPGGIYVDATLGGGGHSHAIATLLKGNGHLYSIDRDADAIAHAFAMPAFTAVHGDFRYLTNYIRYYGHSGAVDGILADLGVSSHHFDDASRGFSFRSDAPLDMRMNQSAPLTAADLLDSLDVDALASIFKTYGEFRQARRLSQAIVAARANGGIRTTGQLAEVAKPLLNPARAKKELCLLYTSPSPRDS